MKQLRVSSRLCLHPNRTTDIKENICDGIRFNKKIGFDAADLSLKFLIKMTGDWQPVIEGVMQTAETEQLPIEICHMPYSTSFLKHPEELPAFNEAFHRAIDAVAVIKPKYAVMHPNTTLLPLSDYDRAAQYDNVMEHLSPFVEHAQKVGVTLVVENMIPRRPKKAALHRYCEQPDELCEVADALGVGVCWDTGHAHAAGLKQSEAIGYLGNRLKMLHLNDNRGTGGDDHLPPFLGKIDWQDTMSGLSLVGFEGLLNFEVHLDSVPDDLKQIQAKYILETSRILRQMM